MDNNTINTEQLSNFLKNTGLDTFEPGAVNFNLDEIRNTDIIEGLKDRGIKPLLDMYCIFLKIFKNNGDGSNNNGNASNNDGVVNFVKGISSLIKKINVAVNENQNSGLGISEADKELLSNLSKFYIDNKKIKIDGNNLGEDYIDEKYNVIKNQFGITSNTDVMSLLNNNKIKENIINNVKPFFEKLKKGFKEEKKSLPILFSPKDANSKEKDNEQDSLQNEQDEQNDKATEPLDLSSKLKQKPKEIPVLRDIMVLGVAFGSYGIAAGLAPVFTPIFLLGMLYFLYKYMPNMGKVFKYNSNYIDNFCSNSLDNSLGNNNDKSKAGLPSTPLIKSFKGSSVDNNNNDNAIPNLNSLDSNKINSVKGKGNSAENSAGSSAIPILNRTL